MIDKKMMDFMLKYIEVLDEDELSNGMNVLSESLSVAQKYLFDYIIKEMVKVYLKQEKIINELKRRIEELQKELTFAGVADDGC